MNGMVNVGQALQNFEVGEDFGRISTTPTPITHKSHLLEKSQNHRSNRSIQIKQKTTNKHVGKNTSGEPGAVSKPAAENLGGQ